MRRRDFSLGVAGLAAVPGLAAPIHAKTADAAEVRIARQYGLPYLSMMVMERQRLIEKHAARRGLPALRAQWTTLGGTSALTDGLMSGQLDFIVPGAPALVTLWDKTVGTAQEVRALSAVQSMPFVLVTRNPAVHSIADFGEGDRIALPAVKISAQAVALEMAAAKLWGFEAYDRLDALTVTLPHPDAVTALLAGNSPITSHYTVSPFYYYELANPALRAVLKSYDTLGGKHQRRAGRHQEVPRRQSEGLRRGFRRARGGERLHRGAPARSRGDLHRHGRRYAQPARRDRAHGRRSRCRIHHDAEAADGLRRLHAQGRPPQARARIMEGPVPAGGAGLVGELRHALALRHFIRT
jgi:ABC-type nitrate/sulfonate/bicarbonate transport system substrate-binding protein